MPKEKRTSYLKDPIAWEAEQKERELYLADLFHPIYYYTKDIQMQWMVPGFIPRGYLVLLAADPKEGKTSLATALALAVACGTPFAGMPTKQAAVLWLSLEEGPHERRYLLQQSGLADTAIPFYTCHSHIDIDTQEGIEALDHWITEVQAGLIIVDPLHGAHSGRSLMDGWSARRTLMKLKELCVSRDVTALVLHHAKLPSRWSGSKRVAENAQLSATASMEIVLSQRALTPAEHDRLPIDSRKPKTKSSMENRKSSIETVPRLLTLHCRGRGHFANQTIHLLSRSPLEYARLDNPELPPEPAGCPTPAQIQILELLKTGSRRSDQLMDELLMQEGTFRNALTALRRLGLVRVVWKRGRIRRYGLTVKATENKSVKSEEE